MIEQMVSDKCCKNCEEWKPLTAFARRKDSADGRRHICRPCRQAQQIKYEGDRESDKEPAAVRANPTPLAQQPEADLHRIWQSADLPVYEAANFGTYRINQGVAA